MSLSNWNWPYIPINVISAKHTGGFDFLGYRIHPDRKLRPAVQSLNRLLERARRLYEQGVDENRLRQYVQRWFIWPIGGLRNRVIDTGGFNRIWLFVLKHLNINHHHHSPSWRPEGVMGWWWAFLLECGVSWLGKLTGSCVLVKLGLWGVINLFALAMWWV